MTNRFIKLLLLIVTSAAPAAAQTPRPMTLVDLLNVPRLSDPRPSPDGREVVYVQTQADWKANKRIGHPWRIPVASGAETRITNGDYSIVDYQLSHDGRRIAAQRAPSPKFGDGDQGEVWVMDGDGGNAVQITKNTVPESGPMLSPDNSRVLFLSQ